MRVTGTLHSFLLAVSCKILRYMLQNYHNDSKYGFMKLHLAYLLMILTTSVDYSQAKSDTLPSILWSDWTAWEPCTGVRYKMK